MSLTDTHCHLDLPEFDRDREAVVERARLRGVSRIVLPALSLESSRRVVALSAEQAVIFAAVGVHPTDPPRSDDGLIESLQELAGAPKVVAIGEIGLDYYWVTDKALRSTQQAILERQLMLAGDVGLPVILHMREAGDADDGPCAHDLLGILDQWIKELRRKQHPLAERPGVLHSFAGTLSAAREAIALGFCIGVTGPVTYKNAAARRAVVSQLPLDRVLLETDSPFLSPVPHRGQRNEPAFLAHIADKIAEIQSRTVAEVAQVTENNAARLFAWGESA